jgi:hypothetical protein
MTTKNPRTVTEYRLLVQRTGNAVKDWRARSLKAVERRIGLLTSPEPWRFYGDAQTRQKGPDDYVCCAGTYHDQCGCGGMTMREETAAKRSELPPIESIKLQKRTVTSTPWESCDAPTPIVWYPCVECGADHDVPTCPFASEPDIQPETLSEA